MTHKINTAGTAKNWDKDESARVKKFVLTEFCVKNNNAKAITHNSVKYIYNPNELRVELQRSFTDLFVNK